MPALTPQLLDVKRIFRQEGPPSNGLHFGCRIAQARDGNLFLTTGEHYCSRDFAQRLDNHLGKVIRIAPDGSVPKDNPFVGRAGAKPEIWSYGHRNSQGALIHPATGKLWMHEHGPRGGDEINIPQAGKNYGWPVIGYGIDYSGAKIHESTHKEGMEQPIRQWTPVIAPSGFAIYQGDLFPAWKGNAFIGGLVTRTLVRLELDGEKVTKEERLLGALNERIRDVRAGPDGALWLLTDNVAGTNPARHAGEIVRSAAVARRATTQSASREHSHERKRKKRRRIAGARRRNRRSAGLSAAPMPWIVITTPMPALTCPVPARMRATRPGHRDAEQSGSHAIQNLHRQQPVEDLTSQAAITPRNGKAISASRSTSQ